MSKLKIFMFGCWNKNLCLDGNSKDGRKEVMELLESENNDFDFGILLGDNIYPKKFVKTRKVSKKKRKSKRFLIESKIYYKKIKEITNNITKSGTTRTRSRSGTRSITRSGSGINLHVILGNHDVENRCIKRNQEEHFKTGRSIFYKNSSVFETPLAVFLMINTNNLDELYDFLESFDPRTVGNRWLILCGHEPLYSFKKKKNKLFQKLSNTIDLLEALKNYNHKKMAYFCADTHNFQLLEIYFTKDFDFLALPLCVIGTGGASPDKLNGIEENIVAAQSDNIITNIHDYDNPFGYVELVIKENKINICYKKCDSERKSEIIYFPESEHINIDFKGETPKKCYIDSSCDTEILPSYMCE